MILLYIDTEGFRVHLKSGISHSESGTFRLNVLDFLIGIFRRNILKAEYLIISINSTKQYVHLPSPDGLYSVSNPIDAFFHVGPSPILQVRICCDL